MTADQHITRLQIVQSVTNAAWYYMA